MVYFCNIYIFEKYVNDILDFSLNRKKDAKSVYTRDCKERYVQKKENKNKK
jgi:hypothetical protein